MLTEILAAKLRRNNKLTSVVVEDVAKVVVAKVDLAAVKGEARADLAVAKAVVDLVEAALAAVAKADPAAGKVALAVVPAVAVLAEVAKVVAVLAAEVAGHVS